MFLQNASTSEDQVGSKEEQQESHRKHSTVQSRKTNTVLLTLNFLGEKKNQNQKPTKIKPRDNDDKTTWHKMLRVLKYFPILLSN